MSYFLLGKSLLISPELRIPFTFCVEFFLIASESWEDIDPEYDRIFPEFSLPAPDDSTILENEWEKYTIRREELTMMLDIRDNGAIPISEKIFVETTDESEILSYRTCFGIFRFSCSSS